MTSRSPRTSAPNAPSHFAFGTCRERLPDRVALHALPLRRFRDVKRAERARCTRIHLAKTTVSFRVNLNTARICWRTTILRRMFRAAPTLPYGATLGGHFALARPNAISARPAPHGNGDPARCSEHEHAAATKRQAHDSCQLPASRLKIDAVVGILSLPREAKGTGW